MELHGAKEFVQLARTHVTDNAETEGSARQCLASAIQLFDDGDMRYAAYRALQSLRYSVGVFHTDYQSAEKRYGELYENWK